MNDMNNPTVYVSDDYIKKFENDSSKDNYDIDFCNTNIQENNVQSVTLDD